MTTTMPKRREMAEFTEEVLQMTAFLTGKSIEIAGDEIILQLRFERSRQLPDLSELACTPVARPGWLGSYPSGSRVRLKLERVKSVCVEIDTEESAA